MMAADSPLDLAAIYAQPKRAAFLATAAALTAGIALLDWWTKPYVSIGFLYLFPIMLAAGYLRRWQIASLTLVCAVLQESFSNLPANDRVTRLVLSSAGFVGTGLLIAELVRNRGLARQHLEQLSREVLLREQEEQQLSVLN